MKLVRLLTALLVGVLLMGGAAPVAAAPVIAAPVTDTAPEVDQPAIPIDVRHRYLVRDKAYAGVRLKVGRATRDVTVRVRWKGCSGKTVAFRKERAKAGRHTFLLTPGPRRLGPRSRLVVDVTKPGHQTLRWVLRPSLGVWPASQRDFTCQRRQR